jgi:hypothetical protein
VDDGGDLGDAPARLRAGFEQEGLDGERGVVRRGQRLADDELARLAVDEDEVSKGAPDVDSRIASPAHGSSSFAQSGGVPARKR